MDGLLKLNRYLNKRDFILKSFLDEAAGLINRSFNIKEVTIGLKDPKDGLFRYVAFAGIRESAREVYKSWSYTEKEFFDPKIYPSAPISKNTKILFAEDNPYGEGEIEQLNRPIMMKKSRKNIEECHDGDYYTIYITDSRDNLIGWIEISGTKDNRFPDAITIKWIEILASFISVAITLHEAKRSMKK